MQTMAGIPALSVPGSAAPMRALSFLALLGIGAHAAANTLTQNVSWTIDRAGTTAKYRIVAYGDSIYAGYNGSTFNAAKYAAPTVEARIPSRPFGTRTSKACARKSGAWHRTSTTTRSSPRSRTCRLHPPAW